MIRLIVRPILDKYVEWRGNAQAARGGPDKRSRAERRRDKFELAASILSVLAMAGFTILVVSTLHKETTQSHLRVLDQQAACFRNSKARVAQLNLYWIYFQSEEKLAGPPHQHFDFSGLSPGEQNFLSRLVSRNPSRAVLITRADADYNAGLYVAETVDARDAPLVLTRTPFGNDQTPRKWVLRDHYSCRKAFER